MFGSSVQSWKGLRNPSLVTWNWLLAFILQLFVSCFCQNTKISLDSCQRPDPQSLAIFTIQGASITTQDGPTYMDDNIQCAVGFKPPDYRMRIRINLLMLDIRSSRDSDNNCLDKLSIWEAAQSDSGTVKNFILKDFCGDSRDLPASFQTSAPSTRLADATLWLKWETGANAAGHGGFQIVLTSVLSDIGCEQSPSSYQCPSGDCISISLRCDGVPHCGGGDYGEEGQAACDSWNRIASAHRPSPKLASQLLSQTNHTGTPTDGAAELPVPTASLTNSENEAGGSGGGTTTDFESGGDSPNDPATEAYLWLPLVVVVIFTIVMVVLIMVGRRAGEDNNPLTHEGHPGMALGAQKGNSLTPDSTTTSTTVAGTTTRRVSTPSTTPPADEVGSLGDMNLIAIILVATVFGVVLLICVILACRNKKHDDEDDVTADSNGTRLDLNTNQAYTASDGAPATPPPTYSMIERQTSYASYISQTSSQLSVPPVYYGMTSHPQCRVPPEYDEALDLPEGERRRSTASSRPPSSRRGNSFQRPVRSASGYSRQRPPRRFFARSHSAADDSTHRPRFLSQTSTISESGVEDSRGALSDTSAVFSDEAPSSVLSEDGAANNSSGTSHTVSASVHQGPTTSTPAAAVGGGVPRAAPRGHVPPGPVSALDSASPPQNAIEMERDDSRAPLFRIGQESQESDDLEEEDEEEEEEEGSMDRENRGGGPPRGAPGYRPPAPRGELVLDVEVRHEDVARAGRRQGQNQGQGQGQDQGSVPDRRSNPHYVNLL